MNVSFQPRGWLALALASTALVPVVRSAEIIAPSGLPEVLSAETFFYASVDAHAATAGLRNLNLVKMLQDPEVAAFLEPLMQQFDIPKDDPVGALLEHLPIEQYLAGGFSIGLTGLDFAVGDPDQDLLRVSASNPLSAWLIHKLATVDLSDDSEAGASAGLPQWLFLDGLMSIEPGDELRAFVREFIENPPPQCSITQTQIAGRPIVQFELAFPDGDKRTRLYANLDGPRWLIGGSRHSFEQALVGRRQDSLANSQTYQRLHSRVTAGENAIFTMLDVKRALAMWSSCVPPIVLEEANILGLDSIQGLATAISFVEGGVRESILLAFDGEPHGLLRLSGAFGGGLPTLASAPANTALFTGVRFDLRKLIDILREEMVRLFPNAPTLLDEGLKEGRFGDLTLVDDILPVFGSEVSLALGVPRRGGLIPDALFSLELRDPARFQKLLALAIDQATNEGVAVRPMELTGADSAFSLSLPDAPVQPVFAVVGDHLIGAMSGVGMKTYLANSAKAGNGTLGEGDPGYDSIRRAFAGCSVESTALWLHLDIEKVLPMVYETASMGASAAFEETGLPLDATALPMSETLCKYIKTIALAIHCDRNGLSLDIFSPTGLMMTGAALGIASEMHDEMAEDMGGEWEAHDGDPDMPPGDDGDDDENDDDEDTEGGGR